MTTYGEPLSGDAFVDRRRTGVGGSDAGAILGVSPFASRLGVWQDKRGLRPAKEPSERMVWGNRLQDAILRGYGEDHGLVVERGRFRRHRGYPFVIGHPDGFAKPEGRARRLVEVKTSASLDDRWGEPGSADVPAHYYAQVQHYLLLEGNLPLGDLTVLINGRELRTYSIPFDRPFVDALVEEEATFWRDVVEGNAPEPDGSEDAGRALRAMFPVAVPEEVVATLAVAEYAERYLAARDVRETAEAEEERWAQAIQAFMGSRERLVGPGFRATWGNRKGSTSWKAVAAEALVALQLIASADDEATLATLVEGARDAVESWSASIERNRGKSSRVFSLSRKGDESDG